MVEVEAEQGLVAEQQPGIADQGLGDPEPLLLATREPADGQVGECLGAHLGEGRVDPAPGLRPRPAEAPTGALDAECDEVAAAQREVLVEVAPLRHIADPAVAPAWCTAEDFDRPARRQQAQQDLEE